MMKFRCFWTAALIVLLVCGCAARVSAPPPPSPAHAPAPTPTLSPAPMPETIFTPEATLTPPPGPGYLDGDDFPATIEIPVSREGEAEIFIGSLRISDLGYAIWLMPGFDFIPTSDGDLIRPEEDSEIMPGFALLIRKNSGTPPRYYDGPWEDVYLEFRVVGIFPNGDGLEAEFQYPLETWPSEAYEGAGASLHAMWGTVRVGP